MKNRRYLSALAVKGGSVATLFGLQVLIARSVTNDAEYGFYNYLIAVLNLSSFIVIWGLDKYLVREVSVDVAEGRNIRAWEQIRGARRVLLINLLLAIPALAGVLYWTRPERASIPLLLSLWLLLIGMCFARSGAAVIRAMQKVIASEALLNLLRPLALATGVMLYALLIGKLPAQAVVLLTGSSFLLTAFVTAILSRRTVPQHTASEPPVRNSFGSASASTIQLFRACFPYMLIGLGLPLLATLDVILLGILSTDQEVAMYATSSRLVTLSAVGLTAVNLLIAPRLPILFHQKRFAEMQAMLRRNNVVIMLLTVVPVLVLTFLGGVVLSVFGAQYAAGVSILHILLVGQVVNVFVGPVNLVCMMTHQHRAASLVTVAACVVEAALCYILIPGMGAHGAAWANVVALIFLSLALTWIVLRKVHVNPTLTNTIFGKRR